MHHPQHRERIVVDKANLTIRRGEIVGLAGLMGAGRTELAMSVFGRAYGTNISGRLFKSGKQIQARSVSEAIDHGLAYATEDRKVYGLNLIDDIKRNISGAALGKLASGGWVDDGKEFEVANSYRTSMNIKAPTVLSITGKLSGGNQQKVVLSQMDVLRPRRADPGRAHPRHRRRRQVRDLHHHQQTRRRRQGRPGHLLRATRTAGHLRPHLHLVRGAHHR